MNAALELAQIIKLVAANHKQTSANFENQSQIALSEDLGSDKLFFTSSVLGMKAISRVIEDRALSAKSPSRLFSGFQYLSRFTPQAQRYQRILEAGCQVYIYGVPDGLIERKDNLRIIRLEEPGNLEQEPPALSQFWFVVLDNPQQVSMALLGRELPPTPGLKVGGRTELLYRNYEGVWTYDQSVIQKMVTILERDL